MLAEPARGQPRALSAVRYLAAWSPLVAAYWAALYFTAGGTLSTVTALLVAAASSIVPIVAGLGMWRATTALPLPHERPLAFVSSHLTLAIIFVASWTGWEWLLLRLDHRGMTTPALRLVLAWQAVIALSVYTVITGIYHAIRQSRRARDLAVASERAERLRVQAELASLRAHLNPHFLFNSLHAVMALLRADPNRAESALEHLGELFRYILKLDRQQVERVTLDDEWQFVQSYLWLEQMRMGERLRIEAAMDDDALSCAMPPFTLQPLVENAIRHGIAPKPIGGTVRLMAREREGKLELEVNDDGVGCASTDLSSLGGLGVRAVTQRLRGAYGDAIDVRVQSAANAGYKIRLVFPAEPMAEYGAIS